MIAITTRSSIRVNIANLLCVLFESVFFSVLTLIFFLLFCRLKIFFVLSAVHYSTAFVKKQYPEARQNAGNIKLFADFRTDHNFAACNIRIFHFEDEEPEQFFAEFLIRIFRMTGDDCLSDLPVIVERRVGGNEDAVRADCFEHLRVKESEAVRQNRADKNKRVDAVSVEPFEECVVGISAPDMKHILFSEQNACVSQRFAISVFELDTGKNIFAYAYDSRVAASPGEEFAREDVTGELVIRDDGGEAAVLRGNVEEHQRCGFGKRFLERRVGPVDARIEDGSEAFREGAFRLAVHSGFIIHAVEIELHGIPAVFGCVLKDAEHIAPFCIGTFRPDHADVLPRTLRVEREHL